MKEYKTFQEALKIKEIRLDTMAPGTPLRDRPEIIQGPNGGFCISTLGMNERYGFSEIK